MLKHLLFGLLLSTSVSVTAQKRAVNWNFGENAAINFNRNGVVNVNGSRLHSNEGCASISDLTGTLLFYTDGDSVWNADNGLMSNGTSLGSSGTPTQSAIIVPNPKLRHIYYIFTLDQNGGPSGFRYSEVDMTLSNGLGNVTSNKSISLLGSCAEKITAIRTLDGDGVWVVTHGINNNSFYAFLVTENGVSSNPVISQVGSIHGTQDIGQMKGSPDGNFIAIAARSSKFVEIFDFNAETGSIGSNSSIKLTYSNNAPYGVEFSADALKLYISAGNTGTSYTSIFQYNMAMVVNEVLLRDSEFTVTSNSFTRSLQLAPDGKIYGARSSSAVNSSPYLDVINAPKESGSSCNFQPAGFSLASGTGSFAGLPNFIVNYLIERKVEVEDTCIGDQTQFVYLLEIPDSVYWDFDDPITGQYNHSSDLKPVHKFSAAGVYDVTLFVFNGSEIDTFIKEVNIHSYPNFSLGNDTTICFGQTLLLRPGVTQANYLWQDGRTLSAAAANTTGLYHVRVEKFGCASYDSVYVTINTPSANIKVKDLDACINVNKVELGVSHSDQLKTVTWDLGNGVSKTDSTFTYSYSNPGSYLLNMEMRNEFGCIVRDTQRVEIKALAKAEFAPISSQQCFANHQIVFAEGVKTGKDILKNYRISTGDGTDFFNNGATHTYASSGVYIAKLYTETVDGCRDTTSTSITLFKNPEANYTIVQKDKCEGTDLNEFNAQPQSYNGSIKSTFFFTGDNRMFSVKKLNYSYGIPGVYTTKYRVVDSLGCMAENTVSVEVFEKPQIAYEAGSGGSCVGTDPIQFTNQSSINNGMVTDFLWNFGDGNTSTLENPSHQYADANKYTVLLTVKSDQGCKATLGKEIFTYEVPVAHFDVQATSTCLNENRISFTNASSIKGNDVLSYSWLIDGDIFTDESIENYKFSSSGTKLIKLIVKSDKGCESSKSTTVDILASPQALLEVNNPIQCESSNLFVVENKSLSAYKVISWELSDGRSYGGNSINFSSNTVGTIKLELTVENDLMCRAKAVTFVEIAEDPKANFIAEEVCLNSPMKFENTSEFGSGTFAKVYWDYGDNNSNNSEFNSSHTYKEAGDYSVYLEVESQAGCRDIIVKKVKVKEIPEANFDFHKYGYENEKTVFVFKENVKQDYPNFDWYVDNVFGGSGESFFYSFSDTGHYNVSLIVTNKEQCSTEISKDVFVVPPFQLFFPTAFTPNGDGFNDTYGPEPVEYVSEFDFVIMNRWGTKVFSTKETFRQWDGNFKGGPAENGSYIYVVRVKDVEGVEYTYQGNFLLLR